MREHNGGRTIIYDLRCVTSCGKRFIVEMQNRTQSFFKKRSIFYVARAITEQGRPSDWEYEFMPVYGIFLTNFSTSPEEKRARVDVQLQDMETGKQFTDAVRMIYIQLPNFNKTNEECVTDFDKWIYILKNMNTMEMMPFAQEVFNRVANVAVVENLNSEERAYYEADLKFARDYYATMKHAECQGIEKGIEEGAFVKTKEIILNMKAVGMTVEQIAPLVG